MICNICKEGKLVPIWYGYPDDIKIDMAKNDMIVLGGYPPKDFTHFCLTCNNTHPFIQEF